MRNRGFTFIPIALAFALAGLRITGWGDRVSLAHSAQSLTPNQSFFLDPSLVLKVLTTTGKSGNEEAESAIAQSAAVPNTLPLQPVTIDENFRDWLGIDSQLFGNRNGLDGVGDRTALLQAIDYSLAYLQTQAAVDAYRHYGVPGLSRDRVRRSLVRFRELLLSHTSAESLQVAIFEEFEFYQSVGNDGVGTVEFTGYFAPTYTASRVPTAEYQYPLYRLPAGLENWPNPHPTRVELEGVNGLEGNQGVLQGLELVWMRDRIEAFLVQVQGSAQLQLTDGSTMGIGYAGRTHYPYTSIGRLLVNDGKFSEEELSLPLVLDYFRQYPADLDNYLPQNNRFVFFQRTGDRPPTGSLNQPVTRDRSIATDKSIMPPGALALIHTALPIGNGLQPQQVSRYVLDQDTGGAIRGPGRVDIFMGIGDRAGDRAGLTHSTGHLYYLLLKF